MFTLFFVVSFFLFLFVSFHLFIFPNHTKTHDIFFSKKKIGVKLKFVNPEKGPFWSKGRLLPARRLVAWTDTSSRHTVSTTTTTTTKVQTGLRCLLCSLSFDLNGRSMAERDDAGGGTGSARRRRERRFRSMLRHERMAVAMALAESLHHSAQRPEKAKAREVEEQDQHEALRREKAPPPGMRPGVLQDPAPQGRVGQHSGIAAVGGTAGGHFFAGFPRGGGREGSGGGVHGVGPF